MRTPCKLRVNALQSSLHAVATCSEFMASVLVINSGSSSLKFKLFNGTATNLVAAVTGLVERIGDTSSSQLVVRNQKADPKSGKQTFKVGIRVSASACLHLYWH